MGRFPSFFFFETFKNESILHAVQYLVIGVHVGSLGEQQLANGATETSSQMQGSLIFGVDRLHVESMLQEQRHHFRNVKLCCIMQTRVPVLVLSVSNNFLLPKCFFSKTQKAQPQQLNLFDEMKHTIHISLLDQRMNRMRKLNVQELGVDVEIPAIKFRKRAETRGIFLETHRRFNWTFPK
jgi:hypothetical protein